MHNSRVRSTHGSLPPFKKKVEHTGPFLSRAPTTTCDICASDSNHDVLLGIRTTLPPTISTVYGSLRVGFTRGQPISAVHGIMVGARVVRNRARSLGAVGWVM